MSSLHYLYEYSLNFFMDTIMKLLENDEKLKKIDKKEYQARKDCIYNSLFEKIFLRMANSLLSKDLIIFCLKLVSIKLNEVNKLLFDKLIKPSTLMSTRLSKNMLGEQLNEEQLKQIEELEEHPTFSNLVNEIEQNETEWIEFLQSASP